MTGSGKGKKIGSLLRRPSVLNKKEERPSVSRKKEERPPKSSIKKRWRLCVNSTKKSRQNASSIKDSMSPSAWNMKSISLR